jgi:hypothetical protein
MNANLLDVLQNANAIEILTRILDEQSSGPHSTVRLLLYIYENSLYQTTLFLTGNVQPHFPNII